MQKLEKILNKFLGPFATFMSNNMFFKTLAEAFIRLSPITLGAAFIMIIGNFPIPAWIEWLKSVGLYDHFAAVQGASLNAIALFIVFNFAYYYVKEAAKNLNPMTAGLIAIANFLIVMPQKYLIPQLDHQATEFPAKVVETGVQNLSAFGTDYTGGSGIIVAIFVGWLTAVMFIYFNKKNLVIKLPETVPSNVAESLSPSILAGLMFGVFTLIRLIFAFVPFLSNYGDIFTFIGSIIQEPLQHLVSSPLSIILIFTFANIAWFFGIHPNAITGVVKPLILANNLANKDAWTNGKALPFLLMIVVASAVQGSACGGQGATLGLIISMFKAKSKRFKELFKLAVVPSIFNINEPLVFGMPIMMNPIFFLPMVLCPLVMGFTAWGMTFLLHFTELNPMIELPWTAPGLIKDVMGGGWKFLLIGLTITFESFLIWRPFFLIADKRAVEEEKANEAEMQSAK